MNLSASERFRRLKETFTQQLPQQLETIRSILGTRDEQGEGKAEALHRELHRLKGTAASFGLHRLARAADAGERLAKSLMEDKAISEDWEGRIKACLAAVEKEIRELAVATPECFSPMDLAMTEMLASSENQKTVYLCEDDPIQCSGMATQITCFGFRVKAFEDLETFRQAVFEHPPDAIVMDMIHHDRDTGGAEIIRQIRESQHSHIPVIFISIQADLKARLAAVRTGSSAYLVKPVNPLTLCSMLQDMTADTEPEPYRVMIVEDDPHLAELYSIILRETGMETRVLTDPMQALALLSEFTPDLILMDVYMPGCNGMELAGAIRQMDAYLSIPIIFLSKERDTNLQFDARRMGGDEFLIKPIQPGHLVSAVSVRAERMKLIRSFMVKDSMTGLYNHSAIREHLIVQMEHARRKGENLCFAMIDIDHFKKVNDTYGHPVGDQVLVAVSRLLKQRLRKSDVIGRYGGEEFVVILQDCSLEEASRLLEQLRESFAAICFKVGELTFSCSFSCGVASFASHDDLESLCMAADEALYAAKKSGRNRVFAAAADRCFL